MENNLSAEEWLEYQGIEWAEGDEISKYVIPVLLERYANYKTQTLQAEILTFRKELRDRSRKMDYTGGIYDRIVKQFDKHFNITTKRFGYE